MHVILIAQSRDVTRTLQETLLSHGHSAECTEQGESGIQLLKFRSFDAILYNFLVAINVIILSNISRNIMTKNINTK